VSKSLTFPGLRDIITNEKKTDGDLQHSSQRTMTVCTDSARRTGNSVPVFSSSDTDLNMRSKNHNWPISESTLAVQRRTTHNV